MITRFAKYIQDHLYLLFVVLVPTKWLMERMKVKARQFENFPSVFYAVNVRFQQSNHPS